MKILLSLLTALLPLSAFGQSQGVSMRSTNGVGFGVTTFNGPINATNTSITNIFAGRIQGQGGRAQGIGSAALGLNNSSSGSYGLTIGIGNDNAASGAIVAGRSNSISSSAQYSLVGGEYSNAGGPGSLVSGITNSIEGNYSAAVGSRIIMESLTHRSVGMGQNIFVPSGYSNLFVWNSSTTNDVTPTVSDSFTVNAQGGIFLNGATTFSTSNNYAGNFTGNGAGITNIPASAISNVATNNGNNQFSAAQTINGAFTNTGFSSTTTNYSTKLRVGATTETVNALEVVGTSRFSSIGIFSSSLYVNSSLSIQDRVNLSASATGTLNLNNSFSGTTDPLTNVVFGSLISANSVLRHTAGFPSRLTLSNGTNGPNDLVISGALTATNFLALPTNYVAANFVPTAGLVKIVSSNGAIYSVTQLSTNLIAGP